MNFIGATPSLVKRDLLTQDYQPANDWQEVNAPGGSNPTTIATHSVVRRRDYRYLQGYNIEDYHKKLKSGALLPYTPLLQCVINSTRAGTFSMQSKTTGTIYRQTNGVGALHSLHNMWDIEHSELSQVASRYDPAPYVTKAAANMFTRGFDGGTFLAELGRSTRMVKELIPKLTNAILKWPPWKYHYRKMPLAKGAANAWLEARYGWRLLAYDVRDIQQYIQVVEAERSRNKERAGADFTEAETLTGTWTASNGRSAEATVTTTHKVSLRGSIISDVQVPRVLFSPISTAYEIIPYSFVLDWVANFGAFLSAMQLLALPGTYVSASSTLVESQRTIEMVTTGYSTSVYNWFETTQNAVSNGFYKRRMPHAVPLVVPRGSLREWDFRVIDSVALVTQLLKRK